MLIAIRRSLYKPIDVEAAASHSIDDKFKYSPPVRHNLNPGPGVMPRSVLEATQKDLLNYKGTGISVMEMSHRQPEFLNIARKLERDFRNAMKVPQNFSIFMVGGGATLQFSAVPFNLCNHLFGEGASANFLMTGYWSRKAAAEASKYINVTRVNKESDDLKAYYDSILDVDSWKVDDKAQYFHMCQNETIEGIEYDQRITRKMIDRIKANNPECVIVSDQSSVMGARDLSKENLWDDYGVIFFGAHKNFGTSGLTFLLVKDEVMEKVIDNKPKEKISTPLMMDWTANFEQGKNYFVNTPTMLTVDLCQRICEHMVSVGGVEHFENLAVKRAEKIYDIIDLSKKLREDNSSDQGAFAYDCNVPVDLRSTMNQVFTIKCNDPTKNKQIEQDFINESTMQGFAGLAGHRAVGGLRSTLYNSLEMESATQLQEFMREFLKRR